MTGWSAPGSRRSATLPVADARAAVDPLVPRDNASTLRGNLPIYLTLPSVLAELGVLSEGDPGLTLAMPDGTTREVTPDAVPMETFRAWVFGAWGGLFPESLPPDAKGPLYLRHRELAFWSEALAKPGRDVRRLQRGAAPGRRREHALGSRGQAEGDRSRGPRAGRSSSTCATTAAATTTPSARCATSSRRSPPRIPGPCRSSPDARRSRRPATSSRT